MQTTFIACQIILTIVVLFVILNVCSVIPCPPNAQHLNPKFLKSYTRQEFTWIYGHTPFVHVFENHGQDNIVVKQGSPTTAITVLCRVQGVYNHRCKGGPLRVRSTHATSIYRNHLFFQGHFNAPNRCFPHGWKIVPEYAIVHDGTSASVSEITVGYDWDGTSDNLIDLVV